MNKDKTLILIEEDRTGLLSSEYELKAYHYAQCFTSVKKPLRALRRIWIKLRLPFSRIWFNDWFEHIDDYETLIINMNYLTRNVLYVIYKKNPKLRIIGWYWNTIDKKNAPYNYHNDMIEYWSFDDEDCKKYGLKKNIQYYSYIESNSQQTKDIDIFFVGREKDRRMEVLSFIHTAEKNGLKTDVHLIGERDRLLSYDEVREMLTRSKAILEINKSNQTGFTLRALESLFYGIKLITNNRAIKESEIYNKNNVFIIGDDKEDTLLDFVHSSYDHTSDHLKDDFSLDKWFNNFDK